MPPRRRWPCPRPAPRSVSAAHVHCPGSTTTNTVGPRPAPRTHNAKIKRAATTATSPRNGIADMGPTPRTRPRRNIARPKASSISDNAVGRYPGPIDRGVPSDRLSDCTLNQTPTPTKIAPDRTSLSRNLVHPVIGYSLVSAAGAQRRGWPRLPAGVVRAGAHALHCRW
jgi:hypothetical protein